MKRILLFLSIIFILPTIIYAQDEWYYNSQSLVIDVNVSSSAEIQPKSSDYSVKYITVNLSHYPYTDLGQKVKALRRIPSL